MPTYIYQQGDMNGGQPSLDDLNISSGTSLPSSSTWESMHNQDIFYSEDQTAWSLRGGGAQPPTRPGPIADSIVIFLIISCIYTFFIARKRKKRKSAS